MYWYSDHMNGWGYALVTISMIAFCGLVIASIVLLIRYLGRSDRQGSGLPPPRRTAEEILDERFARGEIDEEEYGRRLDTLHAGDGAGG